ncbi:hypothetical protein LAUMK4_00290 [Mycobacterium persicum]|uniref:Uncharacterized protein n=1 Tax=Mycobacterium persicum TaxID=1487726 RepID=A0ABY6RC19_9MYCO|nr:hypothetical protein [Mycobacterium persicum]VAZ71074.1 hypothetical protein LAUMK15_00643 [Mycobacterium persicum]VAZ87182.1 hypothetical protein LAUMK4_00290 [Mycobacterium persicum]
MSRFRPGDRVRVVSVTNEGSEPVTDPAHPDAIDWTGTPLIGAVGVVTDVYTHGFVDATVHFDHLADNEGCGFVDTDLEPVSEIIPLPEHFVERLIAAREDKLTDEERQQLFRELNDYEQSLGES